MKIVVLDGYTLNPGDLSWDGLRAIAPCEIHDRTPADQILARAAEGEIVLTNKTPLSADTIGKLPKLRYIGVLATGYNIVDIAAAKQRGVPVTNIPTYGTASVAQMVFAHLLHLTQRVGDHAQSVRAGDWARCADFCYWNTTLVELAGLTLGLMGFGRIGRETGKVGRALGMKVIFHDVFATRIPAEEATAVDLDTLFRESDVVSLHCPLTGENKGLVNAARLKLMKPTTFLINTSRGPLVDEPALAEALNAGRIAGAGLDVLCVEPPPASSPLVGAKNCFITPHIAWATRSARSRLLDTAVANVRAFLGGKPQHVVNP